MSRINPPNIEAFFVFNPTLGSEETEEQKRLLFYPDNISRREQSSYIGLCEGVVGFSLDFSNTPCHSIHTEKSRFAIFPCEKDHYIAMVVSNPTITDKLGHTSFVHENDVTPQLDDNVLQGILKRFYSIFRFFNGTFRQVTHREGLNSLKLRLQLLANYYIPTIDVARINYHLDIEGFRFLSVDRTPFLTVQFLLASISAQYPCVKAGAVLYDSKLVWSGLTQECAECLYIISQERLHPWFNAYIAANSAFFPPVREYPMPTKNKSKQSQDDNEVDEETAAKYASDDYALSEEEQRARREAKTKAKEAALGPPLPPLPTLPAAKPAFTLEVTTPSGAIGEDSLLPPMPSLPPNATVAAAVAAALPSATPGSPASVSPVEVADPSKRFSPLALTMAGKTWTWAPLSLSGFITGVLRMSPIPEQSTSSKELAESKYVPQPQASGEVRGAMTPQEVFLPSNLVPRVFNALPVSPVSTAAFDLNQQELTGSALTNALRARATRAAKALARALEEEEAALARKTTPEEGKPTPRPEHLASFLSDAEASVDDDLQDGAALPPQATVASNEQLYLVGYLCQGLTLYLLCTEPNPPFNALPPRVDIQELLEEGYVPGPGYVDAEGFVVRSPALPGTRAPPLGRGSGRLTAPIDFKTGKPGSPFAPKVGGFTKTFFTELETYSRANLAILAELFREQLVRGANSVEQFRFLYFCQMNLALKSTMGVSLGPMSSALVPSATAYSQAAQQSWTSVLSHAGPQAAPTAAVGLGTAGYILAPAVVRVIRQMRAEFAASAKTTQPPLHPLVQGQTDPAAPSSENLTYDQMITAAVSALNEQPKTSGATAEAEAEAKTVPNAAADAADTAAISKSGKISLASAPPAEICVRTKSNGWVIGRRATTSSREFYVILDDKTSPGLVDVQKQMETLSKTYFYSIFIY